MLASGRSRFGSFRGTKWRHEWVRAFCIAIALIQLVMGFALFRQFDWAINGWPLPDVRMTHIFLASIAASIAAPCAWAAWRNELGALRAIGFELMIGVPAVGLYLLGLAADRRERDLAVAGVAALVFGAVWAVIFWWSRQVPLRNSRPLPGVIRASFAGFCAILVVVGGALTAQVDNVFPWTVSPEMSTVIGLIFLSAALLFAWIVAHPEWAYGEMSLTGFLAYDLVLFVPYLDLWRNRNDSATVSSYYGNPSNAVASDGGINELSLAVYLTVLAISAVLAVGMYAWRFAKPPAPLMAHGG